MTGWCRVHRVRRGRAASQKAEEPAERPAAKQPLGDRSNRSAEPQSKAPKAQKPLPAAVPPARPAAPRRSLTQDAQPIDVPAAARQPSQEGAASLSLALPGLEEDSQPVPKQGGTLPLVDEHSEGFSAWGNHFTAGMPLCETLRVTSVTRSTAARRFSSVRLVLQPNAAEGQRMSKVPPRMRAAARARTVPLPADAGSDASPTPELSASTSNSSQAQEQGQKEVSPPMQGGSEGQEQPASSSSDALEQAASEAEQEAVPSTTPESALPLPPAAASSECRSRSPPPLPVLPGTLPGSSPKAHGVWAEGEAEAGASSSLAGQGAGLSMAEAAYSGISAAEEAEALPAGSASMPSWLVEQGWCNETGTFLQLPPPCMAFDHLSAASAWRLQWLGGLQWHNAFRTGQPLRAGSTWLYIPVDPIERIFEVLMFGSAVMPEQVVAGAARFQDLVLASPELLGEARSGGVFSFGAWGLMQPDGSYMLLAEGRQLALPLSFRRASPRTLSLFLACVWHEANRAEAQHLTHTFTASGACMSGEQGLKYPLAELAEWVCLAVAGQQVPLESLAELTHLAVFGTE